jgi:hypothetical protein
MVKEAYLVKNKKNRVGLSKFYAYIWTKAGVGTPSSFFRSSCTDIPFVWKILYVRGQTRRQNSIHSFHVSFLSPFQVFRLLCGGCWVIISSQWLFLRPHSQMGNSWNSYVLVWQYRGPCVKTSFQASTGHSFDAVRSPLLTCFPTLYKL